MASSVPCVSVLMPVFNAAAFLQEALDSILAQTFADFEVVAVDDASTDESVEILRRCGDPRLVVVRNPMNLGISGALNRGLEVCRGEFIARMDADDISLPLRLEKQVRHMRENPSCIMVATGRIAIDERGEIIRSYNRPATGSALIRWKLLTGNFISHPTVMMRRDRIPIPLYEAEYDRAEDYAAWLILSSIGDIDVLPDRLFKYRFHQASVSQSKRLVQVSAALAALRRHLATHFDVAFDDRSLGLWSCPHEMAQAEKPSDFLCLLRWMNPLRSHFRAILRGRGASAAYWHYLRRLVLLLVSYRRRGDLLRPILWSMMTSLFPFGTCHPPSASAVQPEAKAGS